MRESDWKPRLLNPDSEVPRMYYVVRFKVQRAVIIHQLPTHLIENHINNIHQIMAVLLGWNTLFHHEGDYRSF